MRRSLFLCGSFALYLAVLGFAEDPPVKEINNSMGMKLVRVEAGTFTMGSGAERPKTRAEWGERDHDEAPAHEVTISRDFYLGTHEVTNAQYEQFDPGHRKLRGRFGNTAGDEQPVTSVTWQQANDFCAWLAKKEDRPYRLPTEAEWEYACRAGTTTAYSFGDKITPDMASIGLGADGQPKPAARRVGSYKPNAWGLFDMHGNVAEWCADWYGPYEAGKQTDPVGRAEGDARVVRGWSTLVPARGASVQRYCRSANRSGHLPDDANRYTGFRVVQGRPPTSEPLPAVTLPWQQDVKQTAAPKDGPDPAKPYFVNFTKEGKNPAIAKDAWGPIFAQHNHFAAVCVCPNGDVLACWYTCVGEPGRELALAGSRLRAGADKWDPASLFFDVPDVNDHAPVLLCDGKRVYHFCLQALHGWDYASIVLRTSDDSGATWTKPRVILSRDDPQALSQPCSAFVDKEGVIVLAADGDVHKDERLMTSADGGKSWRVGKGNLRAAAGQYAIHPASVPLADGSILTFLRGPHPMPAFVTRDRGDTFEPRSTPFPGIGGGMKTAALRLASGAILVCSIDTRKELVGGGTFAALSLDDGKTWAHVRGVEGVGGYMAAAQAPNGIIYLFGTRMGCVAFNEAWLKEGKPIP
jgi:formylglycine-generating enzyme required for sulfatase activity